MSKRTLQDVFNNDPLGLLNVKVSRGRTQTTESIYVGMYEEIRGFIKTHGREPDEASLSIAEAQLGTRLKRLRNDPDAKRVLEPFDVELSILSSPRAQQEEKQKPTKPETSNVPKSLDDILGSELLADSDPIFNISKRLIGTKTQSTNEYHARRTPCPDFEKFKPYFETLQRDLDAGVRTTAKIDGIADIKQGQSFIVGGLIAYVAEVGEKYEHRKGHHNARTRIIFSNGMESDLLLRSFGASLYKDKMARAITGATDGPLFGGHSETPKAEKTGIVYVLKSLSELPHIKSKRDILHKIGVTGGSVKSRIANARKEATYLLADVEVVAEFTLYGYEPAKVERLLHKFFSQARADIEIKDRFGQPVRPKEWFFIPLLVVEETLNLLMDNTLENYWYDPVSARVKLRAES